MWDELLVKTIENSFQIGQNNPMIIYSPGILGKSVFVA